jgi:hypothetical protein
VLIADGDIALHPCVFGELLLGGLPAGGEIALLLQQLAVPPVATVAEANSFIAWADLSGTGIGYVDVHLLLSTRLSNGGKLATNDLRLRRQAERLGLAYIF